MTPNLLILVATALIPIVIGMLWYSPALLGNAWLKEAGMTQEDMKANQKPLKFFLGFVCNFLLAFGLFSAGCHEFSVMGLVGGDANLLAAGTTGGAFLAEHGGQFSTFGHGVVHGIGAAIAFALPLIGHQCLWSGKSFKYFAIDFGFWLVCMILMGGVIAKWGGTLVV